MIRPVFGATEAVSRFVQNNIEGCERGFGECEAVGFVDNDGLMGGIVYHNYSPESGVIEVSAASIRPWANRETVNLAFETPFNHFGVQMLVARTSEHNSKAIGLWKKVGADIYKIPRLRDRNTAEVIMTITDDQWNKSKFKRK